MSRFSGSLQDGFGSLGVFINSDILLFLAANDSHQGLTEPSEERTRLLAVSLHDDVRRLRQSITDPCRTPAAIQYCIDSNNVVLNSIVDSEGKSFGQKSVIAEVERVNPCIEIE